MPPKKKSNDQPNNTSGRNTATATSTPLKNSLAKKDKKGEVKPSTDAGKVKVVKKKPAKSVGKPNDEEQKYVFTSVPAKDDKKHRAQMDENLQKACAVEKMIKKENREGSRPKEILLRSGCVCVGLKRFTDNVGIFFLPSSYHCAFFFFFPKIIHISLISSFLCQW